MQWRTVPLSIAKAIETAVTTSHNLIDQNSQNLSVNIEPIYRCAV